MKLMITLSAIAALVLVSTLVYSKIIRPSNTVKDSYEDVIRFRRDC